MRGAAIDKRYRPEQGCWQTDEAGGVYTGTILEHLLIQQLAAFYEVGEHNIYRLRGADWNDALDMAAERGESVAFTCAYAGNLRELAGLIRLLEARTGVRSVELLEELQVLLDAGPETFGDPAAKTGVLEQYAARCSHRVSGRRVRVSLAALAEGLEQKADWLTGWLRAHEWIDAGEGEGWYNSYYDNSGRRVEGVFPDGVRMMLTGQVFAIMSGVASDGQTGQITRAADRYLYRPEIGGYRLNTNFHELKFDLGRMFGFAYGEKENGAVFSHMAVMYANALYRRGFVQEGWKALKTLADTALDFDTSHIYPGIPEYFRADGRIRRAGRSRRPRAGAQTDRRPVRRSGPCRRLRHLCGPPAGSVLPESRRPGLGELPDRAGAVRRRGVDLRRRALPAGPPHDGRGAGSRAGPPHHGHPHSPIRQTGFL